MNVLYYNIKRQDIIGLIMNIYSVNIFIRNINIHIHLHIHIYMYIYIYIQKTKKEQNIFLLRKNKITQPFFFVQGPQGIKYVSIKIHGHQGIRIHPFFFIS